ncbi:hypothetical protein [Lactobacillus equicursoris]|uniref:hypothetical protein n=1 Tax=Lactobacillus equicursoris TaxID=420645 RepID=UPI0012B24605|nr:hypothetical protein [Lactobacillus equicursoris]
MCNVLGGPQIPATSVVGGSITRKAIMGRQRYQQTKRWLIYWRGAAIGTTAM